MTRQRLGAVLARAETLPAQVPCGRIPPGGGIGCGAIRNRSTSTSPWRPVMIRAMLLRAGFPGSQYSEWADPPTDPGALGNTCAPKSVVVGWGPWVHGGVTEIGSLAALVA
ncbi:MAG: hypothetical protein ACRD2C_06720 [Acidimicrobiales bacterium]